MDVLGAGLLRDVIGLGDPHRTMVLVLSVFPVPEVVDVGDGRDLREVVLGDRRGQHPLERAGVPRVRSHIDGVLLVIPVADPDVGDEDQQSDGDDEGPDRGHHVPGVEALVVGVGEVATAHPLQAQDVHRSEGEVEADQHHPEVPLAQRLAAGCGRRSWATRSRSRRRARRWRRRRARSGSGRRCSRCRSAGCRPGRTCGSPRTDHRW